MQIQLGEKPVGWRLLEPLLPSVQKTPWERVRCGRSFSLVPIAGLPSDRLLLGDESAPPTGALEKQRRRPWRSEHRQTIAGKPPAMGPRSGEPSSGGSSCQPGIGSLLDRSPRGGLCSAATLLTRLDRSDTCVSLWYRSRTMAVLVRLGQGVSYWDESRRLRRSSRLSRMGNDHLRHCHLSHARAERGKPADHGSCLSCDPEGKLWSSVRSSGVRLWPGPAYNRSDIWPWKRDWDLTLQSPPPGFCETGLSSAQRRPQRNVAAVRCGGGPRAVICVWRIVRPAYC